MLYNKRTILHPVLAALLVVSVMCGCSSSRGTLTYFKDIAGVEQGKIQQAATPYLIEPGDELRIIVTSAEPTASAQYNAPMINVNDGTVISYQPAVETYIVDQKGDINMPVLGTQHVAGFTEAQLASRLVAEISKDVVDPYVVVKIMNFKVRVLGEVRTPGVVDKLPNQQQLTVLDAVALAGDINEYGDRSQVMVLREENGAMTYHRLNLNESESMASPYFFLKSNDVVIIPPTASREANASYNTNNSFKVQVTSMIVSAVSVIASLMIALFVR